MKPEDVELRLRQLPLPEPPDELTDRIRQEAQRRIPRTGSVWGMVGVAAALLFAGLLAWLIATCPSGTPVPTRPQEPAVDAAQRLKTAIENVRRQKSYRTEFTAKIKDSHHDALKLTGKGLWVAGGVFFLDYGSVGIKQTCIVNVGDEGWIHHQMSEEWVASELVGMSGTGRGVQSPDEILTVLFDHLKGVAFGTRADVGGHACDVVEVKFAGAALKMLKANAEEASFDWENSSARLKVYVGAADDLVYGISFSAELVSTKPDIKGQIIYNDLDFRLSDYNATYVMHFLDETSKKEIPLDPAIVEAIERREGVPQELLAELRGRTQESPNQSSPKYELALEIDSPERFAFAPDGSALAYYDGKGKFCVVELPAGTKRFSRLVTPEKQPKRSAPRHWNHGTPAWSKHGLFVELTPGKLWTIDPKTGIPDQLRFRRVEDRADTITSLAFAETGDAVLSSGQDLFICLAKKNYAYRLVLGNAGVIRADAAVIIGLGRNRNNSSLCVYARETWKIKAKQPLDDPMDWICAPPDLSRLILARSHGEELVHVDSTTLREVARHPVEGKITAMTMRPDGRELLVATEDGQVLLYDPVSFTPVCRLNVAAGIDFLAIADDGSFLGAATTSKIRIYKRKR
ncbi:MAG: hypothetical protein HYY16_02035 [Planctomycetes bacterium]|nr:hypothetical protein [Planctomycetota bacterium]